MRVVPGADIGGIVSMVDMRSHTFVHLSEELYMYSTFIANIF